MHTIIGVMGGGEADATTRELARDIGRAVAQRGWVLLNGGRDCGVMAASAEGAAAVGGLVVGVLPGDDLTGIASGVTIPVLTGMGDARNVINVLSSRIVIALPGGAGTISEIALALKSSRPVIVVGWDPGEALHRSGGSRLVVVDTAEEAIVAVERLLVQGTADGRDTGGATR